MLARGSLSGHLRGTSWKAHVAVAAEIPRMTRWVIAVMHATKNIRRFAKRWPMKVRKTMNNLDLRALLLECNNPREMWEKLWDADRELALHLQDVLWSPNPWREAREAELEKM